MHCLCVTFSQLTTGICPQSCLGFGAVPASNTCCWNNAASSSRRFRMMKFNENWSRKEKYAKSFSYCFMGIYRDKAPYITTRTLTGVLCISLRPPCTLWLLGSGPPQCRYRNSRTGCGAALLPPRDAGHGLCSCLPRLHAGFVGGLCSSGVLAVCSISAIRQLFCYVQSEEIKEQYPPKFLALHCYFYLV